METELAEGVHQSQPPHPPSIADVTLPASASGCGLVS